MAVTLLSNRPQAKATHCGVPVGCDHTDTNLGAVGGVRCWGEAIASPVRSEASTLLSSFLMIPRLAHVFPEYLCHKRFKKPF